MKNKNLAHSFARAFEGLSHILWTQRHVRVQLLLSGMVLTLCYVLQIERLGVLFVLSAIVIVLIAEIFNTAVEVLVNMITEQYHPLAKIAKDVAASGVLIATLYALIVGGAVFFNNDTIKQWLRGIEHPEQLTDPEPIILILLGVLVLSIIVMLAKIRVGYGTILRGGAVSGHTAIAFLLFAAIFIWSQYNPLLTILALSLALLVAQSRVEGRIHTVAEVFRGALIALLFMAFIIALHMLITP